MNRQQLSQLLVVNQSKEIDIAVTFVWFRSQFESQNTTPISEIYSFFVDEAISNPNKTRLRSKLQADRRVLNSSSGYIIQKAALIRFNEIYRDKISNQTPSTNIVKTLQRLASNIRNTQTRSFVMEAIECVKSNCHRAAVIMAWCGAVDVMQKYIFYNHLDKFNSDAISNGLIKRPATSLVDMRSISKESHFIECLSRISVIDDSMKRSLKHCLDRRNNCGHPSDIIVGESTVAEHLEMLILNVFDRFSDPKLTGVA